MMQIAITSLFVDDQGTALEFHTQVPGLASTPRTGLLVGFDGLPADVVPVVAAALGAAVR